jgi:Cof subfamily protein (haloacid dehalogenase superfamily)
VRLCAIDLDGTMLDSEQRLHPRTREAVRAAIAGGVVVVVATGRMYRSALPWARELGVTAPLLCYQGAVVRELPDDSSPVDHGVPLGTLLFEDSLSPAVAVEALHTARSGGWHVQAYLDEQLLCEEDRPEAHLYARIAQVPIDFVDDLEPLVSARGSTKIVCVVEDPAEANRCEATLRERLGASAHVTRSLPPFVEVTNPVASKGRALQRLCARLGVELDAVLAIGDAPNDTDMLAAAGFAVAVQGAAPEVLAAADAVCAPPEHAGVADVLDALGLAGPASRC